MAISREVRRVGAHRHAQLNAALLQLCLRFEVFLKLFPGRCLSAEQAHTQPLCEGSNSSLLEYDLRAQSSNMVLTHYVLTYRQHSCTKPLTGPIPPNSMHAVK